MTIQLEIMPTRESAVPTDSKLRALKMAEIAWRSSVNASNKEKFVLAEQLYELRAFSLQQLAKITRLNVPYLSRRIRPNSGGGKFEPEALSALILIRVSVLKNESVQANLVDIAVSAGCSINCISQLTGSSRTKMHLDMQRKTNAN